MPTSSIADIVFNCPHCRGPIMVERCHIGESSECPHCFEAIQVPELSAVNKDRFVEPPGLRRILQEVRDREWEHMRRKLRTARAQILHLEKDLAESKEAAATAVATAVEQEVLEAREVQGMSAENETLRKQLAEVGEKFVLANQAFTAGRKQHDQALEKLRRDLDTAQKEVQVLHKKYDGPHQAMRTEIETLRQQATSTAEELGVVKANLNRANSEAAELREQLAKALAELEAERIKVQMTQAGVGNPAILPMEDGLLPESASGSEGQPASPSAEEIEKLKKGRTAIVEARDRACAELEAVKKTLAERDHEDGALESALTGLESGIKEVMWALASRRERQA